MTDLNNIPPTTTSYVIATAILAGVTGYFVGQGSSLRLFSSNEKEGWPNSYNVKVHRDSSDEEFDEEEEEEDSEEEEQGELANFDNNNEEVKLVLVIRTDLGMTKGTHYLPYLPSTFEKNLFIANNMCHLIEQAKSPPKPPTQPSPATNTSSPTSPTPRSCAAGNAKDKPKSPCRPNPKRTWSFSRRRR